MGMFGRDDSAKISDFTEARTRMVERHLRERGIGDERVLAAMEKVPRERFIGADLLNLSYNDGPLPIGCGQTISQPLMVATMLEALEVQSTDRVLEIGTGTGYEAAILAELGFQVWTVERHAALADQAESTLQDLGYSNVYVVVGDGSLGYAPQAPYDKILVAAGAPQVPPSLVAQLTEAGTLVVPVGDRFDQQLLIVRTRNGHTTTTRHAHCSFVPLVGAEGFAP